MSKKRGSLDRFLKEQQRRARQAEKRLRREQRHRDKRENNSAQAQVSDRR
jgi:hypothetical protein